MTWKLLKCFQFLRHMHQAFCQQSVAEARWKRSSLGNLQPVISKHFRTLMCLHWEHLIRKRTFSYEMKPGMTGNSIKTLKLIVYALRDIVPALHNTHYLPCSSLAPVYHDNKERCLTSSLICLLQSICFCASHVDENVTPQIEAIYSKFLQNARLRLRLQRMRNGY